MATFKAFKPSGMEKIARSMGYQGSMDGFQNFLAQDPMRQQQMNKFTQQAVAMARGGIVKMQEGGTTETKIEQPTEETTKTEEPPKPTIGDITTQRATTPGLPEGGKTVAATTPISQDQMVKTGTGALDPRESISTAVAGVTQADEVTAGTANTMDAKASSDEVSTALDATQAAQTDPNDPRSKVIAQEQTRSSVSDLNAAQGTGILIDNPVQRELQDGELITGVADAERASKFTEQIQAAEATPSQKATVQGQLEGLMQQFEGGQTPAWAAGAMRRANDALAQRGLGASSLAGQAVIQAAMESALPIAQADASTTAQFEAQNLSNRQQRAMLAAEQRAKFMGMEFDQDFQARVQNAGRIADIANMNFNAEQQIALENSRIANTMNLQNLSNSQAMVMAEAAALSQLDTANLNNRQQASVQNAQNFIQMDLSNLSSRQQTDIFKSQQRIQSLFTDQAAENAARQFNATSQNQVDQFFASLASQTSQYNASQANAQAQFNAGQVNAVERFNQEVANQRDQFNAQNQILIAQNNAQWRREIATADTATINRANEINAKAILDISNEAYANLWQYYADTMKYAWDSAENELDRMTTLAEAQIDAKTTKEVREMASSAEAGSSLGDMFTSWGTAWITGQFGG